MNPSPNGNHGSSGQWTTGLFGCHEDLASCIKTSCCPCITFGQNAVILDKNATSCCVGGLVFCAMAHIGISCLYSYPFRKKLRGEYNLDEEPCGDCVVHWCCTPCAICQEYRELKNRGINPSKGWQQPRPPPHQSSTSTAAPVVVQGMPRS